MPVSTPNSAMELKNFSTAAASRIAVLAGITNQGEAGLPAKLARKGGVMGMEALAYAIITLMYFLLTIHHGTGWL
jgi:hypothetical protein